MEVALVVVIALLLADRLLTARRADDQYEAWAAERRELNQRIQAPEIAVAEYNGAPKALIPAARMDVDDDYWDARRDVE